MVAVLESVGDLSFGFSSTDLSLSVMVFRSNLLPGSLYTFCQMG